MAKLPRTTQKIFGKNAPENQITTFGSIKAGTPVYTQSASQIMNANFEEGWSAAVEDDYAPYRQDRNAVDTALTQQLAYLFQEGIPEWDSGTTYYKGSVVKVVNGNALTFYKSIADNNTASVNTTARWHKMLEINASNQIVSPTIKTPTISGGSMSNGTFSNPTFSGTVNVPLASKSSSTDSTIAASIGWVNNPSLSSNVVHRTGNETIGGVKTFTDNMDLKKVNPFFYIQNTNLTKGTTPTSNVFQGIYIGGTDAPSSDEVSLCRLQYGLMSNGESQFRIRAFKNESNSTDVAEIIIHNTLSGEKYATCPTPATSDNSTKIATTAYVKAQGYVDVSSNQNIGGTKTFVGELAKESEVIDIDTPSTDTANSMNFKDKNGVVYTYIPATQFSNGTVQTGLAVRGKSTNAFSEISIYQQPDGTTWTSAPTPATSDNSTKIATTEWVNSRITSVMDSNKYITRQITYNNDNPTADYTLPKDAFIEVWCQRANAGTGTIQVNYILPSGVTIYRTLSSDNYAYAYYSLGYLPKSTVLRFTDQTGLSKWGYHIYQAGN